MGATSYENTQSWNFAPIGVPKLELGDEEKTDNVGVHGKAVHPNLPINTEILKFVDLTLITPSYYSSYVLHHPDFAISRHMPTSNKPVADAHDAAYALAGSTSVIAMHPLTSCLISPTDCCNL